MRQVKEFTTDDGPRFRVRYRRGGTETSETFRRRSDANTFAALLASGENVSDGVAIALSWLAQYQKAQSTPTYGEWLHAYVNQLTGVTPRTRSDYLAMGRRYLGSIETLPLPLITRQHVTTLVNALDDRELSAKTIKNVVHMLSSTMAFAVEEGHITRNPCHKVRLPKSRHTKDRPRFLEYEDFGRIYEATPEHYKPLVVFLMGTGLRWSEATALQGKHVNLDRGTVSVLQAWKWAGAGKGWVVGAPKSERGTRTVNAATIALAAARSVMRGPDDYLFVTPSGLPVRHNNFYSRVWQPTVRRAGFTDDEPPRIKDLRHTHASWLLSDGMSLEQVQDQLGHESILTTRKVYAHLLPALGVAVGASASGALAKALGNPVELGALAAVDAIQDSHQPTDA